jgi:hypothetical protein
MRRFRDERDKGRGGLGMRMIRDWMRTDEEV